MIDYMLYIWIGFFILSVIVEVSTMNLIAIWFMPGTLLAIVLSLLAVPVWMQAAVWFVVTVMVFAATFRLSARLRRPRVQPTNADRVIGQTGVVTVAISDREQSGQVRVMGQIWSARTDGAERTDETADTIPVDTEVRVLRIEGVKLIVTPV
ncbi:MAG: NfeD family protein [Clostridia bacterium]|nr:NfeD family protein [Clostridia bacterium]